MDVLDITKFRHEDDLRPGGQILRERPPLGCRPRWLWVEKRVEELKDAIQRQVESRKPDWALVLTWAEELRTHAAWLASRKPGEDGDSNFHPTHGQDPTR